MSEKGFPEDRAEARRQLAMLVDAGHVLSGELTPRIAFEQVLESERTVRLYAATILPAARENVAAAQSAYTTGKVPFLKTMTWIKSSPAKRMARRWMGLSLPRPGAI